MSDRLEDEAEFWLPSEFLTEEDILMNNKENLNAELCFPSEFPYHLDSAVHGDDQLAELTRQLSLQHSRNQTFKKSGWFMSGSPQSTLARVGRSPGSSNGGSPNGLSEVSSPPTTPLGANNDAWDPIHLASGQVAKLKLNDGDVSMVKSGTFLGLQHGPPPLKNPNGAVINPYVQQVREVQLLRQQQRQRCGMWSNEQVRNGWGSELPQQQDVVQGRGLKFGSYLETKECGRGQGAWPDLQCIRQQNEHRESSAREVFIGCGSENTGGGVKRKCAGTGVFLPRRYVNNGVNSCTGSYDSKPAEYRKQTGSPALVPARVVQALNRSFIDVNGGLAQTECLPIPDYGALIAQRNALLMLQQRHRLRVQSSVNNHEISLLPQDWTY